MTSPEVEHFTMAMSPCSQEKHIELFRGKGPHVSSLLSNGKQLVTLSKIIWEFLVLFLQTSCKFEIR